MCRATCEDPAPPEGSSEEARREEVHDSDNRAPPRQSERSAAAGGAKEHERQSLSSSRGRDDEEELRAITGAAKGMGRGGGGSPSRTIAEDIDLTDESREERRQEAEHPDHSRKPPLPQHGRGAAAVALEEAPHDAALESSCRMSTPAQAGRSEAAEERKEEEEEAHEAASNWGCHTPQPSQPRPWGWNDTPSTPTPGEPAAEIPEAGPALAARPSCARRDISGWRPSRSLRRCRRGGAEVERKWRKSTVAGARLSARTSTSSVTRRPPT